MPTLTPIPLTIEEHERLVAMKHRLEANSWREMMMKLCDICEDLYKTNQPIKTDQPIKPDAKPEPQQKSLFSRLLEPTKKEGEKQMDEQDLRRIIREELQDHKFEMIQQEPKPQEQLIKDECEDCGQKLEYAKGKEPKYCVNCGVEFDWSKEEE
jgi:hypothetical protein